MDASTVISIIALTVSVVALTWQFLRSRWDRPLVGIRATAVRGSFADKDDGGKLKPRAYLRVTITNVGERPVTLVAWGWDFIDAPKDEPGIRGFSTWGEDVPKLPARLEPHDFIEFATPRAFRQIVGARGVAWVEIVSRPKWSKVSRGLASTRILRSEPVRFPIAEPDDME